MNILDGLQDYLDGMFAAASSASEWIGVSDVCAYILYQENFLMEFCSLFHLKYSDYAIEETDSTLKEELSRWLNGDGKSRRLMEAIDFHLMRRAGKPGKISRFTDEKKAIDKLSGTKGYGPYFFIEDLFFVSYKGFTLAFFMGNDE